MRAFAAAGGDLHLVMAGPDPDGLRPQLEQLAGPAAANITWTGMLTGPLKWGALRAAEVFILPSHQENFGVAVVEALACNVPVLISNRVNIWREIAQDGAGLIADDDVDGCTRLISGWVSLSAEQRQRMRAATLPSFERRFAMAGAASRLDRALLAVTAAGTHAVAPPMVASNP
jgi:glycosyltransferase involved in cell wall biosynthesis